MTDVGPYASITQHNNIMNKIYHVMPREKTYHVLHRLSLSVQSVYMGWDREDFPPKKMVRDGAKGRGLHATATKARSHRLNVLFNQNLLWTQEREILHLCQLLGHRWKGAWSP